MDSYALLIIARLIHIVGGIFWVGSALFVALFLFPTIKEVGPDGAKFTQALMQKRKLPVYMNMVAGLTILSGFFLYGRMISMMPSWAGSRQGMIFGLGGLCAVLAMVVGNAVNARAGKKMAMVGAQIQASGGAPSAEQIALLGKMQKRLAVGGKLIVLLLTIAIIAMAIARYL